MRAIAALALGCLLALTGCAGHTSTRRVPDVTGDRLDLAEAQLDERGLGYEPVGGGIFGIVVRSNWVVCSQDPAAGRRATRVVLYVDRDCWDW